ncbi:hypothetical protein LPJ61_003590 [Coemansia biformis]|uniref:Uncharacterized protein n=1 Tax=Coemansia biformis TaxID=1286918 RepID=A0A9W8CVF5_9FUNG|nr:hypothetical protein LPJ61_003590 [Coemansia biformis]
MPTFRPFKARRTSAAPVASESDRETSAEPADAPHTKGGPDHPAAKKGGGKRGKVFSTLDSMLSILDQVGQAEDAQARRKIQRQHDIKGRVDRQQTQAAERKQKKTNRLEEMKTQLQRGFSLGVQGKPVKKRSKPKSGAGSSKELARTLSSVNRDWDKALGSNEPSATSSAAKSGAGAKPKRHVTFAC